MKRFWENVLIYITARMPRSFVYWCAIRVFVNATTGNYSDQIVPEVTCAEALQRWEKQSA